MSDSTLFACYEDGRRLAVLSFAGKDGLQPLVLDNGSAKVADTLPGYQRLATFEDLRAEAKQADTVRRDAALLERKEAALREQQEREAAHLAAEAERQQTHGRMHQDRQAAQNATEAKRTAEAAAEALQQDDTVLSLIALGQCTKPSEIESALKWRRPLGKAVCERLVAQGQLAIVGHDRGEPILKLEEETQNA